MYPTAPVYNSVPMVQDGETLYYILPGMAIYIQKMDLDIGKAGGVSYNRSTTLNSLEL